MNDNETKTKAQFYSKKKTIIHLKLESDIFYNGIIMEVGNNFLIIHDRFLGDTFVNFSEIKKLEPYNSK